MEIDLLNSRIVSLMELVGGPRDIGFLHAAFSDENKGDIAIALVELSMAGKISIGTRGIELCKSEEVAMKPLGTYAQEDQLGVAEQGENSISSSDNEIPTSLSEDARNNQEESIEQNPVGVIAQKLQEANQQEGGAPLSNENSEYDDKESETEERASRASVRDIISANRRFNLNLEDFDDKFKQEFSHALESFQVLQIAKDRFFSIKEFETLPHPVVASDFITLCNDILDFAKVDEPFSVKRLRTLGLTSRIDLALNNLGLGKSSLDFILEDALAPKGVKSCSVGWTKVFCKTTKDFNPSLLLEHIIETKGRMRVSDMTKYLTDEFDAHLIQAQVRAIVRDSKLEQNGMTGMISFPTPTKKLGIESHRVHGYRIEE